MNKENVAYTLRVCVLNMAYKKKRGKSALKKRGTMTWMNLEDTMLAK